MESTATESSSVVSATSSEVNSLVMGYWDPALQQDAAAALRAARPDGFDYVTTALPILSSSSGTLRTDVTALEAKWWRTSVVGVIEQMELWPQQLPWAWHMNLPAVLLPPLPNTAEELAEYAQQLQMLSQEAVKEAGYSFQLWVPLPLNAAAIEAWQFVSSMSNAFNVGLLLQLESTGTALDPLQYVSQQLHTLHNALGCGPVMAVSISTSQFLTNKRGFPTLSKAHQWIAEYLMQRVGRTVRWLLQGPAPTAPLVSRGSTGTLPHLQYLQHIRQRPSITCLLDTQAARDEADYLDALQKPLQPLGDHLGYATYEVFEKDPVKYQQYQAASRLALADLKGNATCHVLVVGAGRGPLVTGVLLAYQSLPVDERPDALQVVAVEKNPSAVLYLQSKLQQDPLWQSVAPVTIVQADLRSLAREHTDTADLVVSELLGSFGCNELSPECLDALLERCKPETISIPSSYTSHIAPMSSRHIHGQIVNQQAFFPDSGSARAVGRQTAVETPYVVRTHAASQLYAEQDCWSFAHPAPRNPTRFVSLEFGDDGLASGAGYGPLDDKCASLPPTSDQPSVITGLLGTFTAVLYKDCFISTAPQHFSQGMYSWFPLYFPLNEPVHVPAGARVRTHVWRKTEADRVWYEWSVAVRKGTDLLSTTPIHNSGGRSYHVALS
jgi:protein arginine N-methyltransferase 5